MDSKTYTYEAGDVTVTWDRRRCIHAQACVDGLPEVFDPERRPWIDPDAADADAVEEVVLQCPTGALHLTRDGDNPEPVPDRNRVSLFPNGPLLVRGDVEIVDDDGETLLRDTRVALCRCGRSGNKPLCDGSHDEGFDHEGTLDADRLSGEADGGRLRVRVADGGPLLVDGPLALKGTDGRTARGSSGALCRCGRSGSKPFCDGSHADAPSDEG
jgi:CDGSH-type Zn-finger protein/uncharacterized Fe-S cluster protein YjdI